MKSADSRHVVIICAHRPGRSPSQRYRFEQYLPLLEKEGFSITVSPLLDDHDDRIFYTSGQTFSKAFILFKCLFRRIRDLRRLKRSDIVFIQREALFTGGTFYERAAAKRARYLIFDFDDCIWIGDTSPGNSRWSWLKRPAKFYGNVRRAKAVIAGNDYLASVARKLNVNTTVIPTTVDTSVHVPMPALRESGPVTIGWSGSISTVKHFGLILPVLVKLQNEFGESVQITLMGAHPRFQSLPHLRTVTWSEANEVTELNKFSIGIMPLPDDDWSRGKCGLKALTYMACGIPVVTSPFGVNSQIVEHNVNGLLASNHQEWYDCLSRLIKNRPLRERLGAAGRKTVEERYSVAANAYRYLEVFRTAAGEIS